METVEAYIFTYEYDRPVAQIMVSVRPNYDEAFPWDVAADITYEDIGTGEWHAFPSDRVKLILDDIRTNDKDKWAQIVSAAKANFAPEFARAS